MMAVEKACKSAQNPLQAFFFYVACVPVAVPRFNSP